MNLTNFYHMKIMNKTAKKIMNKCIRMMVTYDGDICI